MTTKLLGHVTVDILIDNTSYPNTKLLVLEKLCTIVVIDLDILSQHVHFFGDKPLFSIHRLSIMNIEPLSLFKTLKPDCKAIIDKSCRHNRSDNNLTEIWDKGPAIIERRHYQIEQISMVSPSSWEDKWKTQETQGHRLFSDNKPLKQIRSIPFTTHQSANKRTCKKF